MADPGFFLHRIAPKWLANLLLNINSGVLGVLLKIFFGDPISTLSIPNLGLEIPYIVSFHLARPKTWRKRRLKQSNNDIGCDTFSIVFSLSRVIMEEDDE